MTSLDFRPLVLCVDDEPLLRQSLGRLLRLLGADTVTASNGREALEILAQMDPLPDLIITDLAMPELGGEDLFRAVRGLPRLAAIPIAALSGQATSERFDLYVAKPFGGEDLRLVLALATLPRRLGRRGGASPEPAGAVPHPQRQ